MSEEAKIYNSDGKEIKMSDLKSGEVFREHCDFQNKPCIKFGRGWYDRCAWCVHVNGFKRKCNDDKKPF